MLAAIHDAETGQRLAAERAFLATLDGSCETPIAGLAELDGGTLRLRGEILRPDGSECLKDDASAPVEDAAALGRDMRAPTAGPRRSGLFRLAGLSARSGAGCLPGRCRAPRRVDPRENRITS